MEVKLKGLTFEKCQRIFPSNVILAGYVGSIAHGTYILNSDPNSIDDKDVMGIYVNPIDYYLGLGRGQETKEYKIKEWDVVLYEVRKFISLLLKSNPNVLSLLWLPEKYYILGGELSFALIQNRYIFTSKKAYHSFTGYAYSQLKRMEHYRFEGYMGQKRKELVEKFGYDCKNASHLLRLLRTGIEFLTEGKLYVEREDAPQLVSIKKGEWKLEDIKSEAERLFEKTHDAYINSKLPDNPDHEMANKLLKNMIARYHGLSQLIDWQW